MTQMTSNSYFSTHSMSMLNAQVLGKVKESEFFIGKQKGIAEEELSTYDADFLVQVNQVLEANIDNTVFSVEILAHKVFVSRSQLFRKLKRLTGQTPVAFIRNFRLDRAMEILKIQKRTMKRVAIMVGFEDAK